MYVFIYLILIKKIILKNLGKYNIKYIIKKFFKFLL